MGVPSMPELLIILAIVVLLFGAKKIPDLAKGIGKGIKNFRGEMKEDEAAAENKADEKIEKQEETTASTARVEETKKV